MALVLDAKQARVIIMAEVIRQAIDHWLRTVSPVSPDERRRRAIMAAQGFHNGVADLSERHDEYLAETYAEISE